MDELIIRLVLSYVSVLDLRRAACTCKLWRYVVETSFDDYRSILLVTVSGSNELVLLSAATGQILQTFHVSKPYGRGKRKRITNSSRRTSQQTWCWPTCLEVGPQGQVYASQYKVQGVFEYNRTMEGLTYRRTLLSDTAFTSPEGLVVAHNCLYVVSVDNSSVCRVSLENGKLLEKVTKSKLLFSRPDDHNGDYLYDDNTFWVLWGMCASPDQRSLFIAGHISENNGMNNDYRYPTTQNTGHILRIDLDADGSFRKDGTTGKPYGYYIDTPQPHQMKDFQRQFANNLNNDYNNFPTTNIEQENKQQQTSHDGLDNQNIHPELKLNRPCNPAFCRHGILHVSSFISRECGTKRRIFKFTCNNFYWLDSESEDKLKKSCIKRQQSKPPPSLHLGWLEATISTSMTTKDRGASTHRLQEPWGIAFSHDDSYADKERSNVYVTCSSANSPSVVKLSTCGCTPDLRSLFCTSPDVATPSIADSALETLSTETHNFGKSHNYTSFPRAFPCGSAKVLAGCGQFDQANFVLSL